MSRSVSSAPGVVAILTFATFLLFATEQVKAEVSLSYVRGGSAVCATAYDLKVFEATNASEPDGSCARLDHGDYYHVTKDWSPDYQGDDDITVILFDGNQFYTKSENVE